MRIVRRELVKRGPTPQSLTYIHLLTLREYEGEYFITIDEDNERFFYLWNMTDRHNAIISLSDFAEAVERFRTPVEELALASLEKAVVLNLGKDRRW